MHRVTLAPELSPVASIPREVVAVCFDVDATLVDYEASTRAGLRELLGTDDAWAQWCALTDEHYARYLAGQVDFDVMRRHRTKDFFACRGELLCDGEVVRREERRAAAVRRAWKLFDDALPCLRALRALGMRLAAVTNAAGDHQRAKLGALGLESTFDAVLISGELGVAKPHRGDLPEGVLCPRSASRPGCPRRRPTRHRCRGRAGRWTAWSVAGPLWLRCASPRRWNLGNRPISRASRSAHPALRAASW